MPYRSSPLGHHLELHVLFVFLQYIWAAGLFGSEWFGDISHGNKCCSRYFVHAVSTGEQVCNLFPMSSGKGFLAQKILKLILLMILSGPKLSFDIPAELSLEDSNFTSDI